VVRGQAVLVGKHAAGARLRLNVGLAVTDQAVLDETWRAMTTPGSPTYGVPLTKAQYRARFSPRTAAVDAARSWLEERGLTVTDVTPDHLLVHVRGSTRAVERAFGRFPRRSRSRRAGSG
jgi:subtilase family serine protease